MNDQGIGSWIERRARIAPNQAALVADQRTCSYAELASRIRRLAHGLRRLGVQRGDRVGWLGPNHPAFLETLFAAAKLGAALSPVNHRLDPAAIDYILEDAGPRVVVLEGSVATLSLPLAVRSRVVVGNVGDGSIDYERLVAESADEPIDESVGLDDLCLLPYTSGTTGRPKGVMLTHGNVTWNVVSMLAGADFRSDDVTIAIAPFFRVGGTGVNVLPVLFKGGTVIVPGAFDLDEILRLIEHHRVTVGFGNPDLLEALTRSPLWPSTDLSSIRFVITGGFPVPDRLIRQYLERRVVLLQGYGLSEAAPAVLLLDPERALRKPGSAGQPLLLVDVRIVRPDGANCGPGETGELLVSGPNVMAGYWNRSDATSQAIDDEGWLHTGDAARVDADGDFWIVDRVADSYRSAGQVVYPGAVEQVLTQHPQVVDAGVVGVEDGGEVVGAAFVVLDPPGSASERDLLEFCQPRLARHEVPRSITIVERIPRTTVGKLLRSEVRQLHEKNTGEARSTSVTH